MESKSFVKLLRKVIREEVRAAVRTEIKSVLNESTTITRHESNLQEIVDDTKRFKPKAKRKFSKNPILNDLLNDTSPVPADTNMMGAYRNAMTPNQPLVTTGINGEPVNMANEQTANVMENITKDYSALMKAIDKKKGR